MKKTLLATTTGLALSIASTFAANVIWVSDASPDGMFSAAGTGYPDDGYVNFLSNAGFSVTRYNSPDSGALPAADIAQLNSADLIIVGRAINSGGFDSSHAGPSWNNDITAPLLNMNAYLVRSSRLGWFTGATLEDAPGVPLSAVDLSNPTTQYLFNGVSMTGDTMDNDYNTQIDRGVSSIALSDGVEAGGVVLATATFTPVDGAPTNFISAQIAEFPAGTSVRAGADTLAGYRLFFADGSREPDGGSAPTDAGMFDLTADGQIVFMNAVNLTMNAGVVPEPSVVFLVIGGLGLMFWRRGNRA